MDLGASTPAPAAAREPWSPYQKKLLVFLSVATFFEGYDFIALTQVLPNLRAALGLDRDAAGYLVGFINAGTFLAYLLIRRADRWGRRRVLTVTIVGYTLCTFLSGLAPGVYSFAVFQLLARIFLIGEWAVAMVVAAEEFPASARGTVIGVIQGFSSLGSIACAGVVPLLLDTSYGWRTVYLVGIVPLVILAVLRRSLKETRRFAERGPVEARSWLHVMTTPYRRRILLVGLVWLVAYIGSQNAITFWKEFAVGERGMSDADVGKAIVIAALGSMPLVFASGRLLDGLGRRRGAVVIFGAGAAGMFLCYTLHGFWPLTLALVFGIFFASAFLPVMNAFTTELFPTELRADAFAWCNNLIGRIGYVLSPVAVGYLAGQVGAFGPVVRATAIFPVITAILILALLPETKGKELEETARL